MSSRFNTLYLGSAADAADELEVIAAQDDAGSDKRINYLRLALVNALRRIQVLEDRIARRQFIVPDHDPR